jgi:ribosomal-protein-serine acetyltransferase
MNRVILEVGSRIILKQYIAEDADVIFQLIDDSRAHLSQYGDITADKYPAADTVRRSIVQPYNPERLRLGIWEGSIFVGGINITPNNKDKLSVELGYWLGQRHQGQGYIKQSVNRLIKYVFDETEIQLIYAITSQKNVRSKNVLVNCGFSQKQDA